MHQNTFCLFNCFFNKIKYGIAGFIFRIKYNLIVLIKPEKCKISNPNRLPMVRYLFSCTIDNMSYLISDNKLNVLRSQFVSDKQSILDFDGPNHVTIKMLDLIIGWLNLGWWASSLIIHNLLLITILLSSIVILLRVYLIILNIAVVLSSLPIHLVVLHNIILLVLRLLLLILLGVIALSLLHFY
jgi:hypothetical protein